MSGRGDTATSASREGWPQETAAPTDASDLVAIVRDLMNSMGDRQRTSIKPLVLILHALSTYIHTVKAEIAALHPEDLKGSCIPAATDELEAIVVTTAEATNAIMDAAEAIQTASVGLAEEKRAEVFAATARIFEACAFQDITGQRISKVIHAFRQIEERIDAVMATFEGDAGGRGERDATVVDRAPVVEAIDEMALCNGPQLPDFAKSQAEIDALFDSL